MSTLSAVPSFAALAAKIAADELASIIRRAFTRPLPEEQWRSIIGEIDDALSLFEARGWLDDPMLYHQQPTPIRRVKTVRAECRGLDFRQISFASDYEPHPGEPGHGRWVGYRSNRTAHAAVVQHRGHPRPWLVCIPGYGMGVPFLDMSAFSVAWLFERLGLNVLIPVLPFHGPRRVRRSSGDGFLGSDCLDTIHAEAQALHELRQLIGWLRDQDAPAIGVYGLSLGGYTAALLAGFDAELACVIAGIPACDFARLARLHTPPGMLSTGEKLGLDWRQVELIFRVISPLVIEPLVPKERRFIFAGTDDRIVPMPHVRDLWNHWERPETMWYRGSHLSFYWEREVREWLRKILRASICTPLARPTPQIEPVRQVA